MNTDTDKFLAERKAKSESLSIDEIMEIIRKTASIVAWNLQQKVLVGNQEVNISDLNLAGKLVSILKDLQARSKPSVEGIESNLSNEELLKLAKTGK